MLLLFVGIVRYRNRLLRRLVNAAERLFEFAPLVHELDDVRDGSNGCERDSNAHHKVQKEPLEHVYLLVLLATRRQVEEGREAKGQRTRAQRGDDAEKVGEEGNLE